ncbi:MAG: hypothetical protein ABI729_00735, partial [Chitinophagales bacterium]
VGMILTKYEIPDSFPEKTLWNLHSGLKKEKSFLRPVNFQILIVDRNRLSYSFIITVCEVTNGVSFAVS